MFLTFIERRLYIRYSYKSILELGSCREGEKASVNGQSCDLADKRELPAAGVIIPRPQSCGGKKQRLCVKV